MDWFEEIRWPAGRDAPTVAVSERAAAHAKMPYWCDCRSYFSVKVGTVMESSKIRYQKWAIAFYRFSPISRGFEQKLRRDLGISQKSAWFMGHRLREAMNGGDPVFSGPVEADETLIGGKEENKHESSGPDRRSAGLKDRGTNQVDAPAPPEQRRLSIPESAATAKPSRAPGSCDMAHTSRILLGIASRVGK